MIKVKCWNDETKEWEVCAYPLFKGMNPCEIIGYQDEDGSDKLIEDGHVVVLYSGVNDRYDNEIYAGDIVKHGNVRGEVVFVDGRFVVELGKQISLGEQDIPLSQWEVIGNIYKHRHLLRA